MLENLETFGQGIDRADARIMETRESLQSVLDRDIDVPEFRLAIARLERVKAELNRNKGGIMAREGSG